MYMLYSSIFAFYLPCVVMSLVYGYIFYTLKKRLRAIQLQEMAGGQFLGFGADVGNIAQSAIETVIGECLKLIETVERNHFRYFASKSPNDQLGKAAVKED